VRAETRGVPHAQKIPADVAKRHQCQRVLTLVFLIYSSRVLQQNHFDHHEISVKRHPPFYTVLELNEMTKGTSLEHYYMPAEWSPHEACLILYPHNPATFSLAAARQEVIDVATAIARDGQEKVYLFCKTREQAGKLKSKLKEQPDIVVEVCPSNDSWARDTGPTFVVHKQQAKIIGLDWDFNAYGGAQDGCYWPCTLDHQVAASTCQILLLYNNNIDCHNIPLILEGGSIHTDGEGTLMTTKECLLNSNRNPHKSQSEIEDILLQATGCSKIIWLPHGLAFDEDTNGHVDNWACFVRPGHIVLAWTDDETNDAENYQRCRTALQILESERDAKGRALTIHKLYLPTPTYYSQQELDELTMDGVKDTVVQPRHVGERLAGSYVNFYIANEAVIVPQLGDPVYDTKAIATLTELFPDRKVVGVYSRQILLGGGNIHCITQEVPKC